MEMREVSLTDLSPINTIYLNMLWLILLTLHKKVEIVLTMSSASQERRTTRVVTQKAPIAQRPVCDTYQSWVVGLFFKL